MIATLRVTMERFFENPTEDTFADLTTLLKRIVEEGRPYFETLMQLTRRIRTFQEAQNFRVNIPDKHLNYVYRW